MRDAGPRQCQCGIRKMATTLATASATKNPTTTASALCIQPPQQELFHYRFWWRSRIDYFQTTTLRRRLSFLIPIFRHNVTDEIDGFFRPARREEAP